MSLVRFLWRYIKKYSHWIFLVLLASGVYVITTLVMVSLLRPLFSEVLLATESDLESLSVPGLATGGDSGQSGAEEQLGVEVPDLHSAVDEGLAALKSWLAVPEDSLSFLPILFAVILLVRSLGAFFNGYLFQIVGLNASNDLRNDLYGRILAQSSRFYDRHPSGELVSRLANDISVLQTAVSTRMLDLLQQSLTLIGLIYLLVVTHAQMAAICLVGAPLFFFPIIALGKSMRRFSHRSQERLADVSNLINEAVRGHRVVKAFGMEGFELGRFMEATKRHLRVKLRTQLLANAAGPLLEGLAALAAGAFLIYAGWIVRSGQLSPAEIIAFLVNLILLWEPVRKLNKVNLMIQEAAAAAARVKEIIDAPNDIVEKSDAKTLGAFDDTIVLDHVSFSYGREQVLRDVDLTIRRGEVVALVGPSGAGKSTLVNLLPRFFDPENGAVTIDGIDIRDLTLSSLRALIGIVTQETVLFNDTVRNNVAYGREDLPLEAVREAAAAAYADGFVEAMPDGWDTEIGEGGMRLSGGQRQRLAIARALLKDPPILILDEATSHLDSESEALVQQALYNLMQGRTALVIAHRLSTVQRADRIVVLDGGRVVEVGSHDELLARGGAYKRLYELQFRYDTEIVERPEAAADD
ncbi:MAG: ABC transporter ATP-binding protein [Acidobacteriota bacterium]